MATWLVSGSYDVDARVWNAETEDCLHILHGHRSYVHGVAFDGNRVATSSTDGDGSAISTISILGDHVIAGTTGGFVKITDCQSGETLYACPNGTCDIAVFQIGFTHEHNPVVFYLKDESIQAVVF